MKVNYQYASPSMCVSQEGTTTLGFSPDHTRAEQVSFLGRLKQPLIFRDAMLMLREIVVSDSRVKKKERPEFFQWLDEEIERRVCLHEQYLPGMRESLQQEINDLIGKIAGSDKKIEQLRAAKHDLQKEIDSFDAWNDYYNLERKFWSFIKSRDLDLWYVLDPVITVHPDQVSFEAFSLDESVYGCLSVDMAGFELLNEPKLGTTNIDFSAKLATEMERFRSGNDVTLSVNPDGFTVDTGLMPEYMEKKIDLPESWIKGFNQVSSAAGLNGLEIGLTPVDIYDICSFLRRHKEKRSPRYMKWILRKDEPVRIVFEPFGAELVLKSVYTGEKNREEKIWGRRRWLILERLIPLAKAFKVRLLGFGMPQFITADLGGMYLTVGFTSWSANDWVKGTAFNIMSGFIGSGNYPEVYTLLKQKRALTMEAICGAFSDIPRSKTVSGIGELLKRGEGYFDPESRLIRFRQLCNAPIPSELYETTPMEGQVKELLETGLKHFEVQYTTDNEYCFTNSYPDTDYKTSLVIDEDGQLSKLECGCKKFRRGPRNISAPCAHILALYIVSAKFTRLKLDYNRVYKINDIMEVLL